MYPKIWGIETYAICYLVMILAFTVFTLLYGRKHNARLLHLWMLSLIFFFSMTVGSKALWALIEGVNLINAFAWPDVMKGGMWGGQIVMAALAFAYALLLTRKPGLYLDITAMGLALGLFIAKIGCFFAGCCWGKITTLPWGIAFTNKSYSYGAEPRHPVQLYDAISALAIFIILLALSRKRKLSDRLFLLFLALYAGAKFISELFRAPESFPGTVHYLSYSQIMELITFISALLLLTKLKNIWQRILSWKTRNQ